MRKEGTSCILAVYRSEGPLISEVDFNPFRNPFKPAVSTENRTEEKEEPETALPENRPPEADEEKKERGMKLESMPLEDFSLAQEQLDLIFLSRALTAASGSQKEAARLLGLTYDQFRGLYRKYRHLLVR